MGSKNEEMTVYNPGSIDLQNENPEIYSEIKNLDDLRTTYRNSPLYNIDENRYAARRDEARARTETSIMNRYASLGLAGSSAAMGAQAEAGRQTDLAWDDKQQNDYLKSIQIETQLSGQIVNNKMAIQNQFANFQGQAMQAKQAEIESENALTKGIIGGLGMVAGVIAAPATGGASLAAAAALNSGLNSGGGGGGGGYPAFNYQAYYGQDQNLYGGGGYGGGGAPTAGQGLGFYGNNPYGYGY